MLARVFALSLVLLELASATRPKHVVMVVIDDLGFDDMGFANSQQVATPTFDAMHAAGVSFSNYYVQPSCSPTRATLLTGRKVLLVSLSPVFLNLNCVQIPARPHWDQLLDSQRSIWSTPERDNTRTGDECERFSVSCSGQVAPWASQKFVSSNIPWV